MHRLLARWAGLAAAVFALAGPALPASAQEGVKIRLGTLAPKGSTYHRALQEMGEKWRQAQGPGSSFIVYTDGTQGGEADMVRRMRVGQLNAAMISVVGLMEIDRSVAALQYMPLVFRDWAEVDYVREKLRPDLEKRMLDKGFVVLFWGDVGWARYFSKEPALTPADFKDQDVRLVGRQRPGGPDEDDGVSPGRAGDGGHPAGPADRTITALPIGAITRWPGGSTPLTTCSN
jgi:TRAP-type C4-dicarboxylate transport system substrate-binding protein